MTAKIVPESPVTDGRVHRYHVPGDRPGSKNGWYRFYGGENPTGVYGSWKTAETFRWPEEKEHVRSSPEDIHQRRKYINDRENEIKRLRKECRVKAEHLWETTEAVNPSHPYLQLKKVQGFGLRQYRGNLVVPCRDTEKNLHGLQLIKPDGQKKFLKGTEKSGHYHGLGSKPDAIIYIAEGFATAASVFLATGDPVAVAFDAGNLQPVARALREKYPSISIIICSDNDQWSEGNPGLSKAITAAKTVNGLVAVPTFKDTDSRPTDFNDLHILEGLEAVKLQLEQATCPLKESSKTVPAPSPLRRELPAGKPFPLDTLPDVLRGMADVLCATVQAPVAVIGQSLLAAAALATQAHADIHLDGRVHPISLFLVSLAISGERKSAIDRLVLKPHHNHQRDLANAVPNHSLQYQASADAWKKSRNTVIQDKNSDQDSLTQRLMALGEEPAPPLDPVFMTEDPTFEGLVKLLMYGQPSVGVFSDEGGRFLGGYAMTDQNQLKTAAGLSKLWDGDPITRTRSGDGNIILYNRRCSLHLMLQPELGPLLFANNLLLGQGLLSRCLVTYPPSTVGTRLYCSQDLWQQPGAQTYDQTMQAILKTTPPLKDGTRNELDPRPLTLANDAKEFWARFHDRIERQCISGAKFESIRGLALKAPEHALRIAGALTLIENIEAPTISLKRLEGGVTLVEFYLSEGLRLHHAAAEQPDLLLAEQCLSWIQKQGQYFSTVDLYQTGPTAVRNKLMAERILSILESHRWIQHVEGSMEINGTMRKEVWEGPKSV